MPLKNLDVPRNFRGDVWDRIPEPECKLWGLEAEILLELAENDLIRAVELHRGERVVRLVFTPSLHAYLRRLPRVGARSRKARQAKEVRELEIIP
jgi:hypothetical protein